MLESAWRAATTVWARAARRYATAAAWAAASTVTPRSARLPSAWAFAARTRITLDQSNSVCVTVTRAS